MNVAHCASLLTRPENRTWFRAIQPQHQLSAFQTSHTRHIPSRFNQGHNLFEIFYLAEDHTTALYEVQAMLGSPHHGVTLPNPHQAWMVLNVDVVLHSIADLTSVSQQHVLGTSAQELTGDWRAYRLRNRTTSVRQPSGIPAPTQELGEALFAVPGIEGFRAVSARIPTHMILAVFPEKLGPHSRVEYKDHMGRVLHSIP